MEPAALGALAAILGSVVGGSATVATAWLTQHAEARRAATEAEIRKRERIYVEFISEGSKLLVDGLDHQFESPERFYRLYAILNRIRLRSSEAVLVAADGALTQIVDRCFGPRLSQEELRQVLRDRPTDPLKAFSQACRRELERL